MNFGLTPYFREMLHIALPEALFYVLCFDESHNSAIKKGQVNLHVHML